MKLFVIDVLEFQAGSIGAWSLHITTDTAPPNTSITSSGPPLITDSRSASFSYSGTDDVTAPGSLQFQCRLDFGSFTSCPPPKSYTNLRLGPHRFQVRAVDGVGNVDQIGRASCRERV